MKKITALVFASLLTLSGFPFLQCSSHVPVETMEDSLLLPLLASRSALPNDLAISGNWRDTSDSDAPYAVTNEDYVRLEYLGNSSPKSDYTMSILSFDNTERIMKLSGYELDFSSWPDVTTGPGIVYERIRFYVTDSNTYYYCIESYNKSTLAELDADSTSYEFTGSRDATCGGFLWSRMVRR